MQFSTVAELSHRRTWKVQTAAQVSTLLFTYWLQVILDLMPNSIFKVCSPKHLLPN